MTFRKPRRQQPAFSFQLFVLADCSTLMALQKGSGFLQNALVCLSNLVASAKTPR
jgi:hypothetical protein